MPLLRHLYLDCVLPNINSAGYGLRCMMLITPVCLAGDRSASRIGVGYVKLGQTVNTEYGKVVVLRI